MSSAAQALKGHRQFYPERLNPYESGFERALITALGHLGRIRHSRPSRYRAIVEPVTRYGAELEQMSREELAWKLPQLRRDLKSEGFGLEQVARAFALVRELSGQQLGMRHFDVQLVGGWAMLNGMVVEMRTGEGKTLAATLPACTVALAGIPVHIITVNDYLARRDASWMGPVYRALGLSVGTITQGMSQEERFQAYRCDVTYCTNKEIVFDYLRDRLELGRRPGQIQTRLQRFQKDSKKLERLRLRGLCFAIVDEADSVLIDEARTPLIISGPGENAYEAKVYRQAMDLSADLDSGPDYYVDFAKRVVDLTDRGKDRLDVLAPSLGGFWGGRLRREDLIRKALTARHLYHLDKHYVVKGGRVQIVDEYTGRLMPDRSWEGGLHQLIETKERCDLSMETEVLGRISYQRFFRRYLSLAGMTGTAREATREFWSVYRLRVVTIPTNKPMVLEAMPERVYRTAADKWAALVDRIREFHGHDRPVLVGTRTVKSSEHLARLLAEAGLPCSVLNAVQDAAEAEIIAEAGQRGRITVATNMAGRGTDIKLGSEVAALGGLHVIATERHDAGRVDRQLFGRAGRQGDPGSFEAFVSMEDELIESQNPKLLGVLGADRIDPERPIGLWLAGLLTGKAQRSAEQKHFRMRRELMRHDESIESALAFSGTGE